MLADSSEVIAEKCGHSAGNLRRAESRLEQQAEGCHGRPLGWSGVSAVLCAQAEVQNRVRNGNPMSYIVNA